jgi:aminoglycoside phosphotransferase (APT) family kinase protein
MFGRGQRSVAIIESVSALTMPERDFTDILRNAVAATPRLRPLARARLALLPGRGIAHDHYAIEGARLHGVRVVLRVPRVSQWGLAPAQQLAYEAAAFARAEPSRVTPRLIGAIAPTADLPMGALALERIAGAKPHLPRDLPALAKCLARIHTLPVPPPHDRAPLLVGADPIAETLKAVREQAAFLREAGLRPMAAAAVTAELARAEGMAVTARPPPVLALIGSDTHPGNFLMPRRRRAVFVDLEKAQYGNPAIDLAHASLYTSTMWDPDIATRLTGGDVGDFYRAYFAAVPRGLAAALRPWIVPMRRLIWLRTLTWCIRWRVVSRREGGWSRSRLSPAHAAHIERAVEDFVDPERIASIRESLDVDEQRFSR